MASSPDISCSCHRAHYAESGLQGDQECDACTHTIWLAIKINEPLTRSTEMKDGART